MSHNWSKECLERKMWSQECYVEHEFCCDVKEVTENLKKVQKDFPYLSWGTHIYKKVIDKETNLFYLVVRRFVSREECLRHSTVEEHQEQI